MRLKKLLAAAFAAGLALTAVGARAESIFVDFGGVSPNGSNTNYNYTARLSGTDGSLPLTTNFLKTGDFFVLSDFGDIVGVDASLLTGFSVSYEFTSLIPVGPTSGPLVNTVVSGDDNSIVNIRFTYTGPTLTGPQALGAFTVISSNSNTTQEFYDGRDTRTTAFTSGLVEAKSRNEELTTVAADTGNQTVITPLPATAMGGMVLFGLLGGSRRRK